MFLYKQIFAGLEFCPDPVSCMRRASEGGFAYISWKVSLLDIILYIIFKKAPRPSVPVLSCQIFQQDTIARNFIDGYGKKQIYQVFFLHQSLWICPQAKGYFNTPSYLAWAFQSGSPLKPDFDRVILILSEVTPPNLNV